MCQCQQIRSFSSVWASHQRACHLERETSEPRVQQRRRGLSLDRLNLKKSSAECGQLAGRSSSTPHKPFWHVLTAPPNAWSVYTTYHSIYNWSRTPSGRYMPLHQAAPDLQNTFFGRNIKYYYIILHPPHSFNASYKHPIMHGLLTVSLDIDGFIGHNYRVCV